MSPKYLEPYPYAYLKGTSHLPVRTKADFIIADTSKGSFIAVNKIMKRSVRQVSAKQIASYLRMSVIVQKQPLENRIERLEEQFDKLIKSTWSYVFSKRDIEEMRELSKGMLADSKKMRELAQQLQEADDES
jgi:predicted site-specific integrase-resolvase